jgi:hypothetical protein
MAGTSLDFSAMEMRFVIRSPRALERPSRRVGDKRQFEGSLLALCLQHQEPNEAAAL